MDTQTLGLISVTLNAVNPMTEYIQGHHKGIRLKNYLDTGLQDLVREEGKVTDKSMLRLLSLLHLAVADRVDGVLLTCTVFSPYVDRLKTLFSFPLVGVDAAMLEKAVLNEGKTAILYTFPATRATSETLFHAAEKRLGVTRALSMEFVEGANDALQRGDGELHDQLILKKIQELDGKHDQLVLAQVSMARVAAKATACSIPILTSPEEAVRTILAQLQAGREK